MTNYIRIKFTFIHCAKVLRRAQESGADLYDLLENEIKPVESDMEVSMTRQHLLTSPNKNFIGQKQRQQREFYNRGANGHNTHIIIESSDDESANSGAYVPGKGSLLFFL